MTGLASLQDVIESVGGVRLPACAIGKSKATSPIGGHMNTNGIITMVKLRPKRMRLGTVGLALIEAVARLESK